MNLMLPENLQYDNNDLFSQQVNSQDWLEIEKVSKIIIFGDQESAIKGYKKFIKHIYIGICSSDQRFFPLLSKDQKSSLTRSLVFAKEAVYYFFNKNEAEERAKLFYCNPDPQVAKFLWNFIDNGLAKQGSKIFNQSITYCHKIYVPDNLFPIITIERIKNISKINLINVSYDENIFKKNNQFIRIRVLSSTHLTNQFQKKSLFDVKNDKDKVRDQIIIHIHGGGFISMSSASHQIYTRLWANQLNVPIFSIDYKLAPEFPFPQAINDCFQAYLHILQICEKVYEFYPRKVILVGDSAGGNLIASLTVLCIQTQVRIPDGLLLVYPALNLDEKKFSPSYEISLDEQFLPYSFLRLCLNAYLGENKELALSIPSISPLIAPAEVLRMFPPTRILVGDQDIFHDDCYRFALKLQKLQKDVFLSVFKYLPHGFLNLDVPNGLPQSKDCIKYAQQMLEDLLKL